MVEVKLRKINIGRLGWSGAIYRCFIICCNTAFFLTGIKAMPGTFGEVTFREALRMAFVAGLMWNAINMGLYYLYHYWFLRLFRMGRE